MIMNNYGAYQFNVSHDAQAAVSLTLAAAAEEPTNPYFELNLAKIALAMKEITQARQHLEKARALDGARIYASEIDAISRLLDAQAADKGDGRTAT
jgi:Tfp pilus assembly protein PilF